MSSVEKAASRSLLRMFLLLSNPQLQSSTLDGIKPHMYIIGRAKLISEGRNNTSTALDNLVVPIRYLTPEKAQEALDNFYWVMFVRNPLERLLSSWHDRFIESGSELYVKKGKAIVKKYRNRTSSINQTEYPSVLEFFYFLKDNIGKERRMDAHWRPMHRLCHVCANHFDFIGKVETIDKDVETLLEKLLKNDVDSNLRNRIELPKMRDHRLPKFQDPRYKELRETVPKELTELVLTRIYKTDYDLFGYDLHKDIDEVYLGMKLANALKI